MPLVTTQVLSFLWRALPHGKPIQQGFHFEPLRLDIVAVQAPDAAVLSAANARKPVGLVIVLYQDRVIYFPELAKVRSQIDVLRGNTQIRAMT